jgi:hypothetical protein
MVKVKLLGVLERRLDVPYCNDERTDITASIALGRPAGRLLSAFFLRNQGRFKSQLITQGTH